jgi:hypothetical protein
MSLHIEAATSSSTTLGFSIRGRGLDSESLLGDASEFKFDMADSAPPKSFF